MAANSTLSSHQSPRLPAKRPSQSSAPSCKFRPRAGEQLACLFFPILPDHTTQDPHVISPETPDALVQPMSTIPPRPPRQTINSSRRATLPKYAHCVCRFRNGSYSPFKETYLRNSFRLEGSLSRDGHQANEPTHVLESHGLHDCVYIYVYIYMFVCVYFSVCVVCACRVCVLCVCVLCVCVCCVCVCVSARCAREVAVLPGPHLARGQADLPCLRAR